MAAKQATVSSYVMLVVVVISLVVVNCVSAKPSDVLSKYSRKTILKLKDDRGPRIGLIAVDAPEEEAFFATGDFVPDSENPLLDLAGRRYHYGKIHGKGVVYVRCGVGLRNAVAATTTMIYELYVTGIIHFGVAGNANNSLSIGDVIIPKRFAHTGLWDWRNPNEPLSSNDVAHLEFGSYNVPEGEVTNKLGSVGYSPEEYYSNAGVIDEPEKKFWVETSKNLHDLASKLKGMELQRCVFSSCLLRKPEVVVGLKGSTSDIFVDNAAYREFLFKTFGVSSLDMESAHVVMTSLSADSPVIVFRGLSNLAGAKSEEDQSSDFSSLASINVAEAVVQFIKTLSDEYMDF